MKITFSDCLDVTLPNHEVDEALQKSYGICFSVTERLKKNTKLTVEFVFSYDEKSKRVDIQTAIRRDLPSKDEMFKNLDLLLEAMDD